MTTTVSADQRHDARSASCLLDAGAEIALAKNETQCLRVLIASECRPRLDLFVGLAVDEFDGLREAA